MLSRLWAVVGAWFMSVRAAAKTNRKMRCLFVISAPKLKDARSICLFLWRGKLHWGFCIGGTIEKFYAGWPGKPGHALNYFYFLIFYLSLEHRIDYAHLPGEIGRNVEGRILKLLEESIDGGANFGIVRELCVAAPGNK